MFLRGADAGHKVRRMAMASLLTWPTACGGDDIDASIAGAGTSSGTGSGAQPADSGGATTDGGSGGSAGVTQASSEGSSGGPPPRPPTLAWPDHEPLDCGERGHVVLDSGPGANRINLVVLGDGYTAAELGTTYVEHVDRWLAEMFGAELGLPYDIYTAYFNICRIDVVSNESGVDIPDEDVFVDTAMDGEGSDVTRLGVVNVALFNAQLEDAMSTANFEFDYAAVTLNTDRWFNSGGFPMVYAGGTSPIDVAAHEAGHTFHNLADEYGGDPEPYDGLEPSAVNVTTDPRGGKWSRWHDYVQDELGEIAAFEGGAYHDVGVWRPTNNSKMNQVPALHHAIAIEKIIVDLYSLVGPIDDFEPKTKGLPEAFGVRVIDDAVVRIDWEVDGEVVLADHGSEIWADELGLSPGTHTVSVRVYDDTAWVRDPRRPGMEQEVVWSVEGPAASTPSGVSERAPGRVEPRARPRPGVPKGAVLAHQASPRRRRIVRDNGLLVGAKDAALAGDFARAQALLEAHADDFGSASVTARAAVSQLIECVGSPSTRAAEDAARLLASNPTVRFRKHLRRGCLAGSTLGRSGG